MKRNSATRSDARFGILEFGAWDLLFGFCFFGIFKSCQKMARLDLTVTKKPEFTLQGKLQQQFCATPSILTATRSHIMAQGERSVTLGRKIKIVLTLKGSHKRSPGAPCPRYGTLTGFGRWGAPVPRVAQKQGNPGLLYVTLSASNAKTNLLEQRCEFIPVAGCFLIQMHSVRRVHLNNCCENSSR